MGFAMRGQGSGFSDGFGGYKSIVFGTVVLACAIWAHWRRTPTPYWVVVVLFVLDLALTLYISPRWSDLLLVVGGTMRVLFGYYVVCAAISAGNLARRNRDGGVDDGGGRTEP